MFSGESGDEENLNTPKLTVIKNDNDLETQPVKLNNLNKSNSKAYIIKRT